MPVFLCHICNLVGKGKKYCNLNSEPNYQWPLNSETSVTAHVVNAIMKFDFLYVVGNETVLIDTDIYL